MIDMRVTENNRVDLINRNRERVVIRFLVLAATLNEATLEQDDPVIDTNDILRPGDLLRRTFYLDLNQRLRKIALRKATLISSYEHPRQ